MAPIVVAAPAAAAMEPPFIDVLTIGQLNGGEWMGSSLIPAPLCVAAPSTASCEPVSKAAACAQRLVSLTVPVSGVLV
jgi:hypothetical protein